MDVSHNIRLRLRFYKDIDDELEKVRRKFELHSRKKSEDFKIRVAENHIWIFITGSKKEYWSPHLHLELESKEINQTHIRGLFGPDQTMWTLFMFLHFIVAGTFTIFGMILYSNISLKQPYTFDLIVMGLMVVVWLLLYFIARQIRYNGNGQMHDLEDLFLRILE